MLASVLAFSLAPRSAVTPLRRMVTRQRSACRHPVGAAIRRAFARARAAGYLLNEPSRLIRPPLEHVADFSSDLGDHLPLEFPLLVHILLDALLDARADLLQLTLDGALLAEG